MEMTQKFYGNTSEITWKFFTVLLQFYGNHMAVTWMEFVTTMGTEIKLICNTHLNFIRYQ